MKQPKMKNPKITASLKKGKPDADGVFFLSYYREDVEMCGYSENDVYIKVLKDGAIYFTDEDAEMYIYLYPKQVTHLRKILRGRHGTL